MIYKYDLQSFDSLLDDFLEDLVLDVSLCLEESDSTFSEPMDGKGEADSSFSVSCAYGLWQGVSEEVLLVAGGPEDELTFAVRGGFGGAIRAAAADKEDSDF